MLDRGGDGGNEWTDFNFKPPAAPHLMAVPPLPPSQHVCLPSPLVPWATLDAISKAIVEKFTRFQEPFALNQHCC